ncbi:MAG TPA: alpha/beta family hydrolase [Thermoanaerobaculia bacterium]
MGQLQSLTFSGPAGPIEALWKEAVPPRAGAAVFAHPHPLYGGTLHSRVVYRAAQALTRSGYGTLRFNFRGVGLSAGTHDGGRGETDDFRAALSEAERRGGLPIVAGGFSFGSAVALRAIAGDRRVAAYIGVALPLATSSGDGVPSPDVPALFVVGSRDTLAPPERVRAFAEGFGDLVEIAGADHFFEGHLPELEAAIEGFLSGVASRRAAG